MKKIIVSMEFDAKKLAQSILENRTSSEWADGRGRTGGHPASLKVTIADVIDAIERSFEEEMSCQDGYDPEFWDFNFTDENGKILNEALTLADETGRLLL